MKIIFLELNPNVFFHMVQITSGTHSDTVLSSLDGNQEDLGCKWYHMLYHKYHISVS